MSEGKMVLCDDYGVQVRGGRVVQTLFFFFGFESTLLARQLHQERTQMEAQ